MQHLIQILNQAPPFITWILLFFTCFASILFAFRFWGKLGLYAYVVTAIITANLQVLKLVQFAIFPDPIALGTTVFTSTLFCTDLLYECYGVKAAKKAIYIGFFGFLLFTIFMVLTLGFQPLSNHPFDAHPAMVTIFTPIPSLFIAGMISYLICQHLDLYLYAMLKHLTKKKYIWFRNIMATAVSSFLDSFLFSFIAFYVFGTHSISFQTLMLTYVLGSSLFRLLLSILDTPFLYLALSLKPRDKNESFSI